MNKWRLIACLGVSALVLLAVATLHAQSSDPWSNGCGLLGCSPSGGGWGSGRSRDSWSDGCGLFGCNPRETWSGDSRIREAYSDGCGVFNVGFGCRSRQQGVYDPVDKHLDRGRTHQPLPTVFEPLPRIFLPVAGVHTEVPGHFKTVPNTHAPLSNVYKTVDEAFGPGALSTVGDHFRAGRSYASPLANLHVPVHAGPGAFSPVDGVHAPVDGQMGAPRRGAPILRDPFAVPAWVYESVPLRSSRAIESTFAPWQDHFRSEAFGSAFAHTQPAPLQPSPGVFHGLGSAAAAARPFDTAPTTHSAVDGTFRSVTGHFNTVQSVYDPVTGVFNHFSGTYDPVRQHFQSVRVVFDSVSSTYETVKLHFTPAHETFAPAAGVFQSVRAVFETTKSHFDPVKGTFEISPTHTRAVEGVFDPAAGTFRTVNGTLRTIALHFDSGRGVFEPVTASIPATGSRTAAFEPSPGHFHTADGHFVTVSGAFDSVSGSFQSARATFDPAQRIFQTVFSTVDPVTGATALTSLFFQMPSITASSGQSAPIAGDLYVMDRRWNPTIREYETAARRASSIVGVFDAIGGTFTPSDRSMRPFTTVHLRFDTTAGGFQPDPTLYKPVRWGSLSQVGGSEAMLIAPPVSMTVHANNGPGGRARPVGPDDGSTPSTAVAAGPTASRSAANAVDTTRVIFGAASAVRVGAAVAGVSELDRLTDVLNSTNGRVAASAAMAVTAVGIVRSSANAEGSIANVTPPAKRDRAIMVPLLPGGDPPSLPDPRGVASGSILYYRDYQERPYKAEGWLLHQPATPRNRAAQDELTGMGGEFRGTDASHLIARIFGGDGEKYNLVPFYSDRNKGLINQLETSWRRELQDGTHLYLQVYADYRGKEKIPTALHYYVYELRGSTLSFREKHTVRKDGLDQ